MEAVFEEIERRWGRLDFALHSIAFAPKEDLQGRLVDCSRDGFLLAMDVSCHSFIRMARLAEPLMKEGGALFTMSYYGADKVIENYNLMGPVKSALESAARYLAWELGRKGIRVLAISPGPLKTRAASGIKDFDEFLDRATAEAPAGQLVTIEDVGIACARPCHGCLEADHRQDRLHRRRPAHHGVKPEGRAGPTLLQRLAARPSDPPATSRPCTERRAASNADIFSILDPVLLLLIEPRSRIRLPIPRR